MSTEPTPRVIVFDLDGTLWRPEMYELWGGGAPFMLSKDNSSIAIDKKGTEVRLIGQTRELLQMLSTTEEWRNTHLAISSTCDEPRWAMELLQLFRFRDKRGNDVPMLSLFGDLVEIYKANKKNQHRTILKKVKEHDPTVRGDFSDFIFFDNQQDNIGHVSSIGVTSIYCPNGMVGGVFERGLKEWRDKEKKRTL
ncbi:hypothetical protein, conserved [Trypanosoma brucei gambiense DAL972]|uniref:Magnesium-dependent phosphatase-1 n=2 Tax=Trypanosoma brucei TaxID=5691 RepID=D0A698_TRYB9|nr:hypothetical protein, conserved [Trypanosoma brucei gambiense DAL972]RHW68494.1 magnesium-dependent phosphatase-1/HAD phosphatase [Trypanosoma brucei equiperdum]CBH17199.1 hypothetical protein, conserved [Trypanosoma brucei gambiense DAL972]|eukprot:XP_011779463.1 hypothetical protein, conserved [Trypanosoma brucei gambiense DAL972]